MTTAPDPLGAALAAWLPAQRWYAGKDRTTTTARVERVTTLVDGDPALLHLLVAADGERYQLLLGRRAELPPALADAWICDTDAGVLYAATHDNELMSALPARLRDRAGGPGPALEPEPGARLAYGLPARPVAAEQSNTSLVYGDRHILKLFRRVLPGPHPDVELHRALHSVGAQHVARVLGTITTEVDGERAALGIVQEFLPDAVDGWTLATTGDHAAFTTEAAELGRALARVHAALHRAYGPRNIAVDTLDDTADRLHRRLTALGAGTPELVPHEPALRAAYDRLRDLRGPFLLQRVHGDLHLGQVLRSGGRWTLIDFEGEPGRPLAERNAPRHALQDVAAMLRSFDYAAHHDGGADPDRARVLREAFCAGYADVLDDPRRQPVLLHALELDKAVYEVAYERAHRPAWTHIPLGAINRILGDRG
ncbi:maltokinase N-terminal cap-like domain-containing protein [Saccharothrix obliqua]|uniref:maltokinase N-terminal cap-like domain-containing protein n=1 Tax=Saccharothrix obliqua TaxID=2861747 RepID=UPI001C5E7FC2|nr:aminoglycoside phosphotransferase [Saccharothrix obliqua]MBW4717735.1 aminoglycoside phosphotransferase [Saccharothrix obliqua]